MQGAIFVYGNDLMLLTTRRMIFERAGYTVFTAETLPNAALVLMNYQIDVFVLCQSLGEEEGRAVLETARTLQPAIKTVSLSFDGDIPGLHQPRSLLEAIAQMLGTSGTNH